MKAFIYIIGYPGSGKSTLVKELLQGIPILGQVTKPFAMVHYRCGVQLGSNRKRFPGTDALAMNVQPKVLKWLGEDYPWCSVVLGEGDRLANASFFEGVKAAGWELTIAHLAVSKQLAQERCAARQSTQKQSWWEGRVAKVDNLVNTGWPSFYIDGTASPERASEKLGALPAIKLLKAVETRRKSPETTRKIVDFMV